MKYVWQEIRKEGELLDIEPQRAPRHIYYVPGPQFNPANFFRVTL